MGNTEISRTDPDWLARLALHPIALAVHFVGMVFFDRLVITALTVGPGAFPIGVTLPVFLHGGWLRTFSFAFTMTFLSYIIATFYDKRRDSRRAARTLLAYVGFFFYLLFLLRSFLYGPFTAAFLREAWVDVVFWVSVSVVIGLYGVESFDGKRYKSTALPSRPLFIVGFSFILTFSLAIFLGLFIDSAAGKVYPSVYRFSHQNWGGIVDFSALAALLSLITYYFSRKQLERGNKRRAFWINSSATTVLALITLRATYHGFFTPTFLSAEGWSREIWQALFFFIFLHFSSFFSPIISRFSKKPDPKSVS